MIMKKIFLLLISSILAVNSFGQCDNIDDYLLSNGVTVTTQCGHDLSSSTYSLWEDCLEEQHQEDMETISLNGWDATILDIADSRYNCYGFCYFTYIDGRRFVPVNFSADLDDYENLVEISFNELIVGDIVIYKFADHIARVAYLDDDQVWVVSKWNNSHSLVLHKAEHVDAYSGSNIRYYRYNCEQAFTVNLGGTEYTYGPNESTQTITLSDNTHYTGVDIKVVKAISETSWITISDQIVDFNFYEELNISLTEHTGDRPRTGYITLITAFGNVKLTIKQKPEPPTPVLPGLPGDLIRPSEHCVNTDADYEIGAATNATSYEWEVDYPYSIRYLFNGGKGACIRSVNYVGQFEIRVRAVNSYGESDWKTYNTAFIESCGSGGTLPPWKRNKASSNISDEKLIRITQKETTLNINVVQELELTTAVVKIYTIQGSLVYSGKIKSGDEHQIDLSGYNQGVYIINVKSKNESYSERIIVK